MSNLKQKFVFPSIAIAISFFLATLLVELAFVTISRIQEGRFFKTSELVQRELNSVQTDAQYKMKVQGEDCHWAELFRPHPAYLYVKKNRPPCAQPDINADGFQGPLASFRKNPKVFTILFGGSSVAEDLLGNGKLTTLEIALNQEFKVPGFDRIEVISTAMAGWRQPQTFIAFTMNSHRVDAVVTLDGYNELYLMLEAPNGRLFGTLANPFAMRGIGSLADTKGALAGLLDGFLLTWIRKDEFFQQSHAIYFLVNRTRNKLREIYQSSMRDAPWLQGLAPIAGDISRKETFRYNLEQYKHTLRQTDAIAKRFGIRAIHFLQPVPAEKNKLTEWESSNTGDLSYRDDYRVQSKELLSLRSEQIDVISLHDFFKDTSEQIFNDRIHLNKHGLNMVTRKIVEEIGRSWKLQRK